MTLEYLRQSLYFFRNHLGMIARIQLPFLLLTAFLSMQTIDIDLREMTAEQSQLMMSVMLANVILMPLFQGATIAYLGSVVNNNPFTVFQSLSAAVARWPYLFLVYLVTAIAITGGLMFLIVPGILIMIRLFFADYACVVEKKGIMESVRDSWGSSREYFWPLLNGLGLLLAALLTFQMVLSTLFGLDAETSPMISIPLEMLFGLLGTALTVYGFRIFCIMREAQD